MTGNTEKRYLSTGSYSVLKIENPGTELSYPRATGILRGGLQVPPNAWLGTIV